MSRSWHGLKQCSLLPSTFLSNLIGPLFWRHISSRFFAAWIVCEAHGEYNQLQKLVLWSGNLLCPLRPSPGSISVSVPLRITRRCAQASFSFFPNYLPFSTLAFLLSLVARRIKSQTQRIKKSGSRGNFQLETVETKMSENFKSGTVTDIFSSWEWCSAWFILISWYIIKVG